jgi:glycosyltransferase involved in cell wall biosynthesis
LNGVNTDQFRKNELLRKSKRAELNVADHEVLIMTIAVFRFQKRLKEWIDLIRELQKNHSNVKACIVGDGILKSEIMEHVQQNGMENQIIFAGLQTDVMPWLSAADIFLMTSSFEGLPIALLEAMSMECAIVSTTAGGIKQVIRNGIDGFVESVDDWKQLEAHLNFLILHPEKIIKLGRQARERVVDAFSMKSMVQSLENKYLQYQPKQQ